MTARNAEELKNALEETVATSFSVYQGDYEVAGGSLGSAGVMLLPEGDYRVKLHSTPPVEANVRLAPRDSVQLVLEKSSGRIAPFEQRDEIQHTVCESAAPAARLVEASQQQ